jgi:hypothetical protein
MPVLRSLCVPRSWCDGQVVEKLAEQWAARDVSALLSLVTSLIPHFTVISGGGGGSSSVQAFLRQGSISGSDSSGLVQTAVAVLQTAVQHRAYTRGHVYVKLMVRGADACPVAVIVADACCFALFLACRTTVMSADTPWCAVLLSLLRCVRVLLARCSCTRFCAADT